MKIKLFTHTDLDGIGCAVVAKVAFDGLVNVDYCRYDNIDEEVGKFFQSGEYDEYDVIFITDISVNEEVADLINSLGKEKTYLFDHHDTATWLNEYSWANVVPEEFDDEEERLQITSGTSLFYDWFLIHEGILERSAEVDEFVETVRRYDSWEWKKVYNEEFPNKLNSLFQLLGRYQFVDRFSKKCNIDFTKTEKQLLEVERKRRKFYIQGKEKQLIKTVMAFGEEHYSVGVVFAEQYQSELGDYLYSKYPKLDFIVMVNPGGGSVSLRSSNNGIHLGELASTRDGGGHEDAAGFPIPREEIMDFVTRLMEDK